MALIAVTPAKNSSNWNGGKSGKPMFRASKVKPLRAATEKIDFDDDTVNALLVAKGNMLKGWKGKRTMGKFRSFLSHPPHERDFAF